ncbi:MAG: alpha/beta hydrolase, partial [Chloroflexi bacterium]|nr:alpha/beta hydrolase [Chloroflexota bacterium]
MAGRISAFKGRARLARDSQQWMLDYLVQETGKVFHFQGDERGGLPRSVRNHDMISKHLGMEAEGMEALADAEAADGHRETATDLYFRASLVWGGAQHPIFQNNEAKRYLHACLMRCYGKLRANAPYTIEHVDIPWNGTVVSGNLHLAPVSGPAPLVFYIPGCDITKEFWPHPLFNPAHQRGMHVFSFDGPGQGESNLRGVKMTADNYEEAASAALDVLAQRPDVDADRLGLYAISFGSYWGLRFAARDRRLKVVAAPAASYCDKQFLMDLESPRWKQLMAYITQAEDEEELDRTIQAMTLEDALPNITAPTLMTAGEYDPRSPLEEVYKAYDLVKAPAELWVFADQHHMPTIGGESGVTWSAPMHGMMMDWIRDRLAGKPLHHPNQ